MKISNTNYPRTRRGHTGPAPPLFLEGAILLCAVICLGLAIAYAVDMRDASQRTSAPVTWAEAGSGTLYCVPPTFTVILSIINNFLYRRTAVLIIYSVCISALMFVIWVAIMALWVTCHHDFYTGSAVKCYQRSLSRGSGKTKYFGINEGHAEATIGFAIVLCVLYLCCFVFTMIDHHRNKRRRNWRDSSGMHDGYRRENGGGVGGGGYYGYGDGIVGFLGGSGGDGGYGDGYGGGGDGGGDGDGGGGGGDGGGG